MSNEYKLLNLIYFQLCRNEVYCIHRQHDPYIFLLSSQQRLTNFVKHCKTITKDQTQTKSGPGEKFSAVFLEETLKLTTCMFKLIHPFKHNFVNQRYSSYSVRYDEHKTSGRIYLIYVLLHCFARIYITEVSDTNGTACQTQHMLSILIVPVCFYF